MRYLILTILATSAATAQFDIPDQRYRCPAEEVGCTSLHGLPSFVQPTGTNYTINFVEYKDDGTHWNKNDLPDTLAQLKKARADNPYVLVFLYVHGWQNNADDKLSGDPVSFQGSVANLASQYFPGSTPAGKAAPVVGIYLAWRGLTFTVEPFKHVISYWPRRQAARSIGKEGMFDALKQITAQIGEDREHYMFICVGHSFGARVLENAADAFKPGHPERNGFMSEYRRKLEVDPSRLKAATENELPPADLIFYVNAATSSAVTRRTIADLKDVCKASPAIPICRSRPMYLAVTSTADLATGIVMPVANLVIPALKTDGLRLVSAANSPTLHTHHLPDTVADCPPPPATLKCNEENAFCFVTGTGTDRACYKVMPEGPMANAPFWIMNVGPSIIKDHGDVWNDKVVEMVKAISDQNDHFKRMKVDMKKIAEQKTAAQAKQ